MLPRSYSALEVIENDLWMHCSNDQQPKKFARIIEPQIQLYCFAFWIKFEDKETDSVKLARMSVSNPTEVAYALKEKVYEQQYTFI